MRTPRCFLLVIVLSLIVGTYTFGQNLIREYVTPERIDALAINAKGDVIAYSSNKNIFLLDLGKTGQVRTLSGHKGIITSLAFSPDGKLLASGSQDKNIGIWDLASHSCFKLLGHKGSINSVAFSPDGKYLVSGSDDKRVIVWSVTDSSILHTLQGHKKAVLDVAISPNGQYIASGSDDDTIIIWDYAKEQIFSTFIGHREKVIAVSFSPDGKVLASAGSDKNVKLWDLDNRAEVKSLSYGNKINDMTFSSSPKMLITVGKDKNVNICKLGETQDEMISIAHTKEVKLAVFSAGNTFAVGQSENVIDVYQFPYNIKGRAAFIEPSENKFLDACENGKIVIELTNYGETAILHVRPVLSIINAVPGVTLEFPENITRIAEGETITLEQNIFAEMTVPTGKNIIQFSAEVDSITFDSLATVELHSKAMSADFTFNEPSGNCTLDTEEIGMLILKIKNDGDTEATDMNVKFFPPPAVPGVVIGAIKPIRLIPPKCEHILNVPVSGKENLLTGEVVLQAGIAAGDSIVEFDPPVKLMFLTNGLKPAELIADISINDQSQNGKIESMEAVEIMTRILNIGQLTAKDTNLEVAMGSNVSYIAEGQNNHFLGDIAGGESKDIRFDVYTDAYAQELKYTVHVLADDGGIDKDLAITLPLNTPLKRIDTIPPEIKLIEPAATRGMKIYQPLENIMVRGLAKDNIGISRVLVNDQSASLTETGEFSLSLGLRIGENRLIVDAYDLNQNSRKDTFLVVRQDTTILEVASDDSTFGDYYALIIAVQDYQDTKLTDLESPIQDAERLITTLKIYYTFEEKNIFFLKNPDRTTIIRKMRELKDKLTRKDNLLIFFAGHGYWDEGMGQGYWLPSSATTTDDAEWLPNSVVLDYIRGIKTKHTLLVADACFSGGIFKTRDPFINPGISIQKIYQSPSRKAITSGALMAVPDKSVFVDYLIKKLGENQEHYIYSEKLFTLIKEPVINNSPTHQTPLFGVMSETGDEGGDFIFVRRQ